MVRTGRGTGMVARIALVLLAAVLVEALGTYALHRWQDRELVSDSQTQNIARQLVDAAHAAEQTAPDERARAVHARERAGLALNWVGRSVVTDHSAFSPQLANLRARLVQQAPELRKREIHLSLLPSVGGGSAI